ncbi:MAG TPA: hypothetical protein DCE80_17950 [Ignavibacteriales bacterium]|nr:hypothetical protein [Ignavibacteriales bacterium]
MLKFFFLFLLFWVINDSSLAQYRPENYQIGNENILYKVSDDNPASNSISDIITLGDTVWLGTSRGVSLSTNRGLSWTNFYQTPAFGNESISAIGFDKSSSTFWAATAHSIDKDGQSLPEGSGLRFTTDGGQNWKVISQPLDNQNDTIEVYGNNSIRALPVTVAVQNLVYDIAFTPNTIWIATFASGLRKARMDSLIVNQNYKWQRVVLPPDYLNSISPTDTLNFCLQPVAGKFCSEDNLNHRVFSVISSNDSTLYVGTAGGINKSTDNGISWRKFTRTNQSFPISGNFIVALGYNNYDNTVWGATWKAQGATEFYGVSSSSDGGESWQTFLADEKAHNFGFKFDNVITPSDNGAFRTRNKGLTWTLPNSIIDEQSKLALTTNVFYSAASQGNDVWLGSSDGLTKITEIPGTVWEGKWKVYFASIPLGSKDEAYVFPNPFSPKNDEGLKFKYTTEGSTSNVTIRIYDFAMNYIRTVIQNAPRNISTDIERVAWDGRDDEGSIVPNGVYFYRIEIGDRDPLYGKIIVMQ